MPNDGYNEAEEVRQMTNWFDVDKAGLAKLMAGQVQGIRCLRVVQNAWDQNVTQVDVTVETGPC